MNGHGLPGNRLGTRAGLQVFNFQIHCARGTRSAGSAGLHLLRRLGLHLLLLSFRLLRVLFRARGACDRQGKNRCQNKSCFTVRSFPNGFLACTKFLTPSNFRKRKNETDDIAAPGVAECVTGSPSKAPASLHIYGRLVFDQHSK